MRHMTMLLVLVLAVPARADDKVLPAEEKALSGTWVATGGEAAGKKIDKDDLPLQWTFKAGGKAVLTERTTGKESPFTYKLDPSKSPKTIDITYAGDVQALKDKQQFGIYMLEKDKLTLLLPMPGVPEKDRPTEFSTQAGGVLLMTFERAKEK